MQRDKDGLHIDTSGADEITRAMVKLLPSVSQSQFDSGWLDTTRSTLENTAVVGFLAVKDLYDRVGALQAGRIWQRIHLWATSAGLAMQPLNQMAEVVDRDRQIRRDSGMTTIMDDLTGEPDWRPTFAYRMGYPTETPLHSSRRPVDDVLR